MRNNKECVGILGDGQLALMLAESLLKMEADFYCLYSSPDSPMVRRFPEFSVSSPEKFRERCSVFTLENEFHTSGELENILAEKKHLLFPDLESYQHFSDKISQRRFFDQLTLNSPKWMPLERAEDLQLVRDDFTYPFMIKASQGGYDGKGVRSISNDREFNQVLLDFGFHEGKSLLVEEKIKIKNEVAQGFLKRKDQSSILPLVETIQQDGVCNLVFYPANISQNAREQITSMMNELTHHTLEGIFNFEFFISEDDVVFINEGAPRPHNSQHLTIDASNYSQFDLLAMYLTEANSIPHTLETSSSAMINILGQSSLENYRLSLPEISGEIKVHPKLYDKSKSSPGRKMGHVNIVDKSGVSDLRTIAQEIIREYRI